MTPGNRDRDKETEPETQKPRDTGNGETNEQSTDETKEEFQETQFPRKADQRNRDRTDPR